MPRRNLLILVVVTLAALLCSQRALKNPYGHALANAMSKIESRSLEPIDELELFEGAMKGMLGRLDDYSIYITPVDLQEFEEDIELQFGGVGIEIALDPQSKQLKVLSPLAGSPAYLAGVLAGDRILRIDKADTQDMPLGDAVVLLRGRPGELVVLSILHEGENQPVEIEIVRQIIQVDTVLGDTHRADGSWNFLLEGRDRIGYVRISSFTDQTVGELKRALEWLTEQHMRGLVLDLRGDPGGYFDAAVGVCDLFIRSGVIVATRRRGGHVGKTHVADGEGQYTDFPMAVVVNQQTASAAEIVAACLQDHRRAAIVGQRTYGKSTVQEVIYLEWGCGAMKLTTSSYCRPSGKNIQRPHNASPKDQWGVSPDEGCEVVLTNDEFTRWQLWRARGDLFQPAANSPAAGNVEPFVDRQLLRAVEYVEKKIDREK